LAEFPWLSSPPGIDHESYGALEASSPNVRGMMFGPWQSGAAAPRWVHALQRVAENVLNRHGD
jgi:hypothetical protein